MNEAEEGPEISLQHDTLRENPTRPEIALDTLERYSGVPIADFQKFILLTNFPLYVDIFAEIMGVPLQQGNVLRSAHSKEKQISIIDFRVGAPMGALIMDVLSYTHPQVVLMLGLCGGLHRQHAVGDFIIPVAAIRDEGASLHYMPPQVPSLPAFLVQQFVSEELMAKNIHFHTGVLHTTDYRMWEFDDLFKTRLKEERASAIDMECSALFTVGFSRKVPVGALMLISDVPLQNNGIKTKKSGNGVLDKFSGLHLQAGVDCLTRMQIVNQDGGVNFRRYHF